MKSLTEIIAILGGWTVVLVGIISYIFYRLADKLNIKWKEVADRNIAKLQGEISKSNGTLTSLITLYGASHHQAQDRRIKAIEIIWAALMPFRDIIPAAANRIYNALTEEEIEDFWNRRTDNFMYNVHATFLQEFDFTNHFSEHLDSIAAVDSERPFVGEKIWLYFDLYRIFLSRIAVLSKLGTEKKKFEHWHKDLHLKQLFEQTLSKEEVEYIYSLKINSLKNTMALLENRLIQEIDKTLSGERFSETALDRVKKFENALPIEQSLEKV